MKLLGWMHRKFRQNSGESLKDFSAGQPSLEEQQYYPKPTYGSRSTRQPQKESFLRKSFAGLEAVRVEEDFEEDSSAAFSELFHGLLAIGTLGSDPVVNEPATPTFAVSVENITEKETEVTENDLKLISDELEKVLGAEAKEDGCNDSSGRNSHASTITLSGKQAEGVDTNSNGTSTVCPLQGYLFGSPIELPEMTTVTKKEHRMSLGELFQRTKMVEENSAGKCEREEKRGERESGVHLVKKILRRRILNPSSKSSSTTTTADSVSAETKLHKILKNFHRKVHPEESIATKKSSKSHKYEMKNNIPSDGGYNNGDQMLPEDDIMIFPERAVSKEGIRRYKSHSNPPPFTLGSTDSNGNRAYSWIASQC